MKSVWRTLRNRSCTWVLNPYPWPSTPPGSDGDQRLLDVVGGAGIRFGEQEERQPVQLIARHQVESERKKRSHDGHGADEQEIFRGHPGGERHRRPQRP